MSWVTGAYGGAVGAVCAMAEPANAAEMASIEISFFIFFFLSG
jgi:hypothetical protein